MGAEHLDAQRSGDVHAQDTSSGRLRRSRPASSSAQAGIRLPLQPHNPRRGTHRRDRAALLNSLPAFFRELFAADLPKRKQTAVMAAPQRPAALSALFTPSGEPAWKTIPSWYLVASQDHTIPPEAERAMAERAGATTIEINSSHVAMMSHPRDVAALILVAAK
ncbi:alpha/beta fold hydrolase [Cellulomonas sp. Root137]|uniref:alpha/beta fold hydrolase n=1 Tax=Cellulomonas sp. Root137 TaxID=1736459 RepID=UPI001F2C9BF6|nr:alpha/beta hydrolase [Cellulomonas sp. Root137]